MQAQVAAARAYTDFWCKRYQINFVTMLEHGLYVTCFIVHLTGLLIRGHCHLYICKRAVELYTYVSSVMHCCWHTYAFICLAPPGTGC